MSKDKDQGSQPSAHWTRSSVDKRLESTVVSKTSTSKTKETSSSLTANTAVKVELETELVVKNVIVSSPTVQITGTSSGGAESGA